MSKPKIMVFGSYAVGMTMGCKAFPAAGQTVMGGEFQQFHGGKGSNQAIAAARMGGDVCYVSCVGNDNLGDAAMAMFEKEGLNIRVGRSDKTATGVGFVMVDASGENRIIINFGATMDVGRAEIDAVAQELEESEILLMQLEADIDTITYAAQCAKEKGVRVVLNPAPYRDMPKELLANVDVITPNETEAKQILGLSPKADVSAEELGRKLIEMTGIEHVIITLGSQGALLCDAQGIQKVPVLRAVTAVDTTGAGDTFAGALTVALAEGMSYEAAIAMANEAASMSVTRHGVIEGIPFRKELSI